MVIDITAGHLRVQPFAHITLGAFGALRHFAGTHWPGAGHRLIETELVAKADHDTAITGGNIADGAADHDIELLGVDGIGLDRIHTSNSWREFCTTGIRGRAENGEARAGPAEPPGPKSGHLCHLVLKVGRG